MGEWVSGWECTALCLEAFLVADKSRKYCSIIDAVVGHVLAKKHEWCKETPDFSNGAMANESLASVLMASVILRLSRSYSLSRTLVPTETRSELLHYMLSCLEMVENSIALEPRQFCTVPQLMSYCVLAAKE